MGRIRTIKPEYGHNEELSAMHAEVQLMGALLLTYADDEGYFNANPKLVQAATCPLREFSVSVPEILRRLCGVGYVELFSGSDGKPYGKITNFLKHQRISHPTPSKIKPLHTSSGILPEASALTPESLRPEGKGKEVERKGKEGEEEPPPEFLHPLQLAARLCDEIGMPKKGNMESVASAIEALVGQGKSKAAAYEFLLAKARDALDAGEVLNRFWFQDMKYNRKVGANDSHKTAAQLRNERAKSALDRAFGEEANP